jgi:hypothetical protein
MMKHAVKKALAVVGVAAVGGLFAVSEASAVPVLDFDQGGASGGTLSFDGVNYQADGISFLTVIATGTASDGVYNLDDAELSFDTGGSIMMSGTIDAGGGLGDPIVESGSFGVFGLIGRNFAADGMDFKAEDVAEFFGTGTEFLFSATSILVTLGEGCDTSTATWTCDVQQADFVNTASAVPEPATLGLLGVGLAGLGFAARRRRTAA